MPTVLQIQGYRFYFYANEGREPAHIHVQYCSHTAKFWLGPILLAKNNGMNAGELRMAAELANKNEKFLKEKWHAFFGKKN